MVKTHSFPIEAALRYGLAEAIVLSSLAQWLKSRTADEDYFEREGHGWLKLTMKQFQGELPYFSPFKIKTALEVLEQSRLIRVCDAELNCPLIKRKYMCYTLTEHGYQLTHQEEEENA